MKRKAAGKSNNGRRNLFAFAVSVGSPISVDRSHSVHPIRDGNGGDAIGRVGRLLWASFGALASISPLAPSRPNDEIIPTTQKQVGLRDEHRAATARIHVCGIVSARLSYSTCEQDVNSPASSDTNNLESTTRCFIVMCKKNVSMRAHTCGSRCLRVRYTWCAVLAVRISDTPPPRHSLLTSSLGCDRLLLETLLTPTSAWWCTNRGRKGDCR